MVKHIYSYPAELKNFSLLEHFLLKIKYINRLRLCLLIRYSLRFYISHIPLDRFISLIPNITGALVFLFWMIFTVWSIWFLTIIIFKKDMWRQKYSSQTGIINILGDTYFGEMYTEKRKSRGQTDALQQYGYHYSFEKYSPFR